MLLNEYDLCVFILCNVKIGLFLGLLLKDIFVIIIFLCLKLCFKLLLLVVINLRWLMIFIKCDFILFIFIYFLVFFILI